MADFRGAGGQPAVTNGFSFSAPKPTAPPAQSGSPTGIKAQRMIMRERQAREPRQRAERDRLERQHAENEARLMEEQQRRMMERRHPAAGASQTTGKAVGDVPVAVGDSEPRPDDELRLFEGHHVEGFDEMHDESDAGCLMGRDLRTGERGHFPEAYTGVKLPEVLVPTNDLDNSAKEIAGSTVQPLDTTHDELFKNLLATAQRFGPTRLRSPEPSVTPRNTAAVSATQMTGRPTVQEELKGQDSDLVLRYEREVHGEHGKHKKKILCPDVNCERSSGRGFTRQKNLLEHLRRVHRSVGPVWMESSIVNNTDDSNSDFASDDSTSYAAPTALAATTSFGNTSLRRGLVQERVAGKIPGPVCSRCGARWDPVKGCSRSCDGKQDGLSDNEGADINVYSEYPKKGTTRIPTHLISKRALLHLSYPFMEEGNRIVVLKALSQENIDGLLKLSADLKQSDLEKDASRSRPASQAGDKIHLSPSNRPASSQRRHHDDDEGDDKVELGDKSSDGGDSASTHSDEASDDDEVVLFEGYAPPPRKIFAESRLESRSSEEDTDSDASYSAVFSENSRPQPTDPSSLFDSSSVDRAGSRGYPADVGMLSLNNDRLDESQIVEDCNRSISSVADSINSAVSTGGILGQAGVNYVVAKFTQSDPELLGLYTEASQRLTKDRFVDNNRRLLKLFYLDFAHEEQTPSPSQKEALAFLRSRKRRAEISLDIFRAVTPDNKVNHSSEKDKKEFSMLNAYFETLDAADADASKTVEEDQLRIESESSEVEDSTDPPLLDMNSLQAIGEYFVTSRAFSQYKQRLHQFLHPDFQKQHESTSGHRKESESKDDLGDESTVVEPTAVVSGYQPLASAVTEHLLDLSNRHISGSWIEEDDYSTDQPSRSGDFQEPLSQSIPTPDHHMPWERDSLATWATKLMTDILWPPAKGFQRIWYLCGCDEYSYMDVKELEHGGVETEWRSISESAAAVRRARATSENASPGGKLPEAPCAAHLGPASPINTPSQNLPAQATPHTPQTPRTYMNPASTISAIPARHTPHDPLFLLICINGKAYKTLAELKCLGIDDSYNDELMVRCILHLYEQTRKGHQWTADLLLPTWVVPAGVIRHLESIWNWAAAPVRKLSFIQDLSAVQLISKWWSKCAFNVSPWAPLHIIDTADFVEFELVPHPEGKEAFPTHFTSGCWPPDTKQYRYRPVPMKCVKTMNLWHMRRPGPHTEVYWYNTVPKKVDGPLYRPSGTVDEVVGYGVRINERLNDVLILWWSFIFILATGAFVYVYSHCTGDDSSAFGLGAYLVAAFTVYIQLQYAWWKRT